MKWLAGIMTVVVVVALVSLVASWAVFNPKASKALTEGVQNAGGVPCEVDGVRLSLLRGRVNVRDLEIKNPPQFPDNQMLGFENALVNVRPMSLLGTPVKVQRVELNAPRLRLEAVNGRSNVKVFLGNVIKTSRARKAAEPAQPDEPKKAEEPKEPVRMVVDKVIITDAVVEIGPGLKTAERVVNLGTVELTDLRGPDGEGVTSGELVEAITKQMVRDTIQRTDIRRDMLLPPEKPGLKERLFDRQASTD